MPAGAEFADAAAVRPEHKRPIPRADLSPAFGTDEVTGPHVHKLGLTTFRDRDIL